MLKMIDKIPLSILLVLAVFFTLAPFQPEPHLLEKSRMLLNGTLHKPIDIFDLLMHATPLMLLIVRLLRLKQAR